MNKTIELNYEFKLLLFIFLDSNVKSPPVTKSMNIAVYIFDLSSTGREHCLYLVKTQLKIEPAGSIFRRFEAYKRYSATEGMEAYASTADK